MENEKSLLEQSLLVINIGLRNFADNLEKQEIEVIQVDWQPPAGGDQEMIDLLSKLL